MKRWMQRARFAALAVAAAAFLTACGAGVQFIPVDGTQYPPKDRTAKVEVYEGSVIAPHVVIGTLTAKKSMDPSFDDHSTYDELMSDLKDYARKVGADALIEVRPVTDEGKGLKSQVQMTATAVRFLQKAETVSSNSR